MAAVQDCVCTTLSAPMWAVSHAFALCEKGGRPGADGLAAAPAPHNLAVRKTGVACGTGRGMPRPGIIMAVTMVVSLWHLASHL